MESYPNTKAKPREHAGGNVPLYKKLLVMASLAQPQGLGFINRNSVVNFAKRTCNLSSQIVLPGEVQELHPIAASVKELKLFPSLTMMLKLPGLYESCLCILPLLMLHLSNQ